MKEELLIYVWTYSLFNNLELLGSRGELVEIISPGKRNFNSGPDFFNSKLNIDGQLWAGNVEMHLKSSDWYRHSHHKDKAYSNVILHVVYEHDKEVELANRRLNVLELKNYIDTSVIEKFKLLDTLKISSLYCSGQISIERDFIFDNWINSTYIARVYRKNSFINNYLVSSNNNWEYILLLMLSRSFGLKLNSDVFLNLVSSIPHYLLKKLKGDRMKIEALLFGQAGFFAVYEGSDIYMLNLMKEYKYYKEMYSLEPLQNSRFSFFRTRPSNFPTLRISQLAHLLSKEASLFSVLINNNSVSDIRSIFKVEASEYWSTHYKFEVESEFRLKSISNSFIDRIIINAIVPFKVLFFQNTGQHNKIEEAIEMLEELKAEKNSLITVFNEVNFKAKNAKDSQMQLELKDQYCNKKFCLSCYIGKLILDSSKKQYFN